MNLTTAIVSLTCISGMRGNTSVRVYKTAPVSKQMALVTHTRACLRCVSTCVCVCKREGVLCLCVSVWCCGGVSACVCVCTKQETQEVRKQTDRQMDRQVEDPTPLHSHSAETFNLKCTWHLGFKWRDVNAVDNLTFYSILCILSSVSSWTCRYSEIALYLNKEMIW